MVEISTSILSINKEALIPVIYNLEIGKTNYFHIDVMDGKFVENNTNELMQKYCSSIKLISNIPLDIHLMVEDPLTYINAFIPFNPNIITIHYESFKDKKELINTINYIKNNNIRVGLAIKPNTSIEEIYEFSIWDYEHGNGEYYEGYVADRYNNYSDYDYYTDDDYDELQDWLDDVRELFR